MRWLYLLLFWIAWLSGCRTAAAQSLTVGPTPAWVQFHEAGKATVSSFDGPVTYLLVDRQDSFVGAVPQAYFRLVGRINNPAGLDELSQITADFDPSYEKIIFHGIRIQRDEDQPTIVVKASDFELIRREKESDRQIFDGTLTATYLLHDLRVGDIVEYAYSIVGQHPLFGRKYSGRHDLNWSVPVLEAQIRQIWPTQSRMQWKVNRPDITIQQRVEGSQLITQWTGRKLPPQLEEDQVPTWMHPRNTYTFSNWQGWDEVVRWALPFYQANADSEEAVEAMAQRIRERVREPKAQVEEAIRFVQDDIRYVGMEMGAGSFIPRQPLEVLRKRFGDCKDKTLLLTRLIQKLGFEAFPILVRSEGGQELDRLPPTPLAFNHVIVGVKDPNSDALYWVDGTLQHQGFSLESRDYPLFHQGLPLREGSAELLEQDPSLTPVGRISASERYETEDFRGAIQLTIRSQFSGWQAEKMRSELAAQGSVVLSDGLANFIKKLYPAATIEQEPVFDDDRLQNKLTVTERYSIPDLWQEDEDGSWYLQVAAAAYIGQYLGEPQKVKRQHPLAQMHPLQITHRQDIVVPVEWSVPANEVKIRNAGFDYRMQQLFENGVLSFVHEWQSLSDHVEVDQLAEYLADVEYVRLELERYVRYQPEVKPAIWERLVLIFPQILGLFILFLVLIGWQLQSDEQPGGQIVWPVRSLPFMLLLLILSCGAYALYWYADADRRLRKAGHRLAPPSLLWLSLGIFAAALASRAIQVLMEPNSLYDVPLAILISMPLLHGMWAFLALRLLQRLLPARDFRPVPALILGPLYFQSNMQRLSIPTNEESGAAPIIPPTLEPLLVPGLLHPAEEGHEPRSEGV